MKIRPSFAKTFFWLFYIFFMIFAIAVVAFATSKSLHDFNEHPIVALLWIAVLALSIQSLFQGLWYFAFSYHVEGTRLTTYGIRGKRSIDMPSIKDAQRKTLYGTFAPFLSSTKCLRLRDASGSVIYLSLNTLSIKDQQILKTAIYKYRHLDAIMLRSGKNESWT